MLNGQVHYSDLQLLHDFFCQEEQVTVSDPDHRLVYENQQPLFSDNATFNLAHKCSNELNRMKFYFGKRRWKNSVRFIYVNNPDGTIRWMMPEDVRSASHLSLYNSDGLKARIYKTVSKALFALGKGDILSSGFVSVEQNLVNQVEKKYGISGRSYAIFTGTRGITRKVVIADTEKNRITHFIKVPVNPESAKLIENEISMLSELSKYDFTALSIPRITDPRIKAYARISNIKPAVTIPSSKITEIHLRALAELYAASNDLKQINECAAWKVISNNMEWLQKEHLLTNGLDEIKTKRIIHLLKKIFITVPAAEIPVSVSHGDFTPWNMYCDDQRLYVYDWELASNGIPMLFDMFHFIIQSQVLVHHKGYKDVRKQIGETLNEYNALRMVNRYRIDTDLHYRLYLLFTVSYYLRIYMGEKELLMQSHWMVDFWLDALEDMHERMK